MNKINFTLNTLFVLITLGLSGQVGSLDSTFGSNGLVSTSFLGDLRSVIVQPDGKILATGDSEGKDFAIIRLNSNGSWDNNFGINGMVVTSISGSKDYAQTMALQPDGKIITAGWTTNEGTFLNDFVLVRYESNGTLDTSFGTNGIVTTDINYGDNEISSIVLQSDGKIIAGGHVTYGPPICHYALTRYHPNGLLDNSFGDNGIVITNLTPEEDRIRSLVLQPNSLGNGYKIIAGGHTGYVQQ